VKQVIQEFNCCTGCAACNAICAVGAISMVENDRGFRIPIIDCDRCIECGACTRVCPQQKTTVYPEYIDSEAIIAQIKCKEVLSKSQSGGMFYAIAQTILDSQGVVYGAVLENNVEVRHVRVDSLHGLQAIQGSKYIQSDIQHVYKCIEQDIKKERLVLFAGTPCQCDGIRHYLKTKELNDKYLYLVDLICHGVPSPALWRDYVQTEERINKMQITNVVFRDKTLGWTTYFERFSYRDSSQQTKEIFKCIFGSNICLRQSCYTCPYANLKRVGDISIGDAWSTDRSQQYKPDSGGLSLVLPNTPKGQALLEKTYGLIEYEKKPLKDFMQPNLKQPSQYLGSVDLFWCAYHRFGFRFVRFVYGENTFISKVCRKILLGIGKQMYGRKKQK